MQGGKRAGEGAAATSAPWPPGPSRLGGPSTVHPGQLPPGCGAPPASSPRTPSKRTEPSPGWPGSRAGAGRSGFQVQRQVRGRREGAAGTGHFAAQAASAPAGGRGHRGPRRGPPFWRGVSRQQAGPRSAHWLGDPGRSLWLRCQFPPLQEGRSGAGTTHALQLPRPRSRGLRQAAAHPVASPVARAGALTLAAFSGRRVSFHTPASGWHTPGPPGLVNGWKVTHRLDKDHAFPAPDPSALPGTAAGLAKGCGWQEGLRACGRCARPSLAGPQPSPTSALRWQSGRVLKRCHRPQKTPSGSGEVVRPLFPPPRPMRSLCPQRTFGSENSGSPPAGADSWTAPQSLTRVSTAASPRGRRRLPPGP